MKIVTWNCNGAFRKKYQSLDQFNADILVIQECEDPSRSISEYEDWAGEYLWTGKNKNKGLGVFAKGDTRLVALDWDDHALELFLPCRINDYFNLIGIWTKNPESRRYRYIGQLWKYLQFHKDNIRSDKTVLCGDLNSNAIWDKKHGGCSHSNVVQELEDLGIKSIYHNAMGRTHGHENIPTLYMQRKIEKPYHVDYAFMTELLIKKNELVHVGSAEDWLQHSDHMPLVYSLAG